MSWEQEIMQRWQAMEITIEMEIINQKEGQNLITAEISINHCNITLIFKEKRYFRVRFIEKTIKN